MTGFHVFIGLNGLLSVIDLCGLNMTVFVEPPELSVTEDSVSFELYKSLPKSRTTHVLPHMKLQTF